jgi:hypothetical protein
MVHIDRMVTHILPTKKERTCRMSGEMKAIETLYNGYKFRSRTEARWAVYFDFLGIEYEYELEGYDLDGIWYLPDFWLPQVNMWAEVKGQGFSDEEYELCQKLAEHTGYPCLLLDGPPKAKAYEAIEKEQDGRPLQWEYAISAYHGYYKNENRFYSSPEMEDFLPDGLFDDVIPAVNASKKARFENMP